METETETEQSFELVVSQALTRVVAAVTLGHEIHSVRIEVDDGGNKSCVIRRIGPADIPVWDGTIMDVCEKQAVDGCRPSYSSDVPRECARCMAEIALRQTKLPDTRSVVQDLCEDAYRIQETYQRAIETLSRRLLLRSEVTGDEIVGAMAVAADS